VSKYFAVGTLTVTQEQAAEIRAGLMTLRDELAWRNQGLDSAFHAACDAQVIRDEVFKALAGLDFRFDVTLLEKSKAQPKIRPDDPALFQYAWYYHLKYLAPWEFRQAMKSLSSRPSWARGRCAMRFGERSKV
jgi:hypothetical protein